MSENTEGGAPATDYSQHIDVRVNRGASSVHIQEGPTRSGDILSTARTPNGAPVAQLDDSTVVTVGRVPMRLGMAVAEGFVSLDHGQYREVSPAVRAGAINQQHEAARAEAAKHAAHLEPQDGMLWDDTLDGLKADGYDSIAILGEMAGGRKLPEALLEWGAGRGMGAIEVKNRVNNMSLALGEAIQEQLLDPAGIDQAEWNEFIGRADRKNTVDRAFIHAAARGDLVGYRSLVESFLLQKR